MIDDLVGFDIGLMAKEKGFNELCYWSFHKNNVFPVLFPSNNEFDDYISAPTQSLLQKWLREKYCIWIDVNTYSERGFTWFNVLVNRGDTSLDNWDSEFSSYKKALEKGLFKGLELIKNK